MYQILSTYSNFKFFDVILFILELKLKKTIHFYIMTASLLQLVSVTRANAFFTFEPQITFFKTVFLTHTIFAIDLEEEFFSTNPNFDEEGFCELSKLGDLISNIVVKIKLPNVHILKEEDKGLYSDYSDQTITNNDYTLTATQMIPQYGLLIDNFRSFSNASMDYWRNIKNMAKHLQTHMQDGEEVLLRTYDLAFIKGKMEGIEEMRNKKNEKI